MSPGQRETLRKHARAFRRRREIFGVAPEPRAAHAHVTAIRVSGTCHEGGRPEKAPEIPWQQALPDPRRELPRKGKGCRSRGLPRPCRALGHVHGCAAKRRRPAMAPTEGGTIAFGDAARGSGFARWASTTRSFRSRGVPLRRRRAAPWQPTGRAGQQTRDRTSSTSGSRMPGRPQSSSDGPDTH